MTKLPQIIYGTAWKENRTAGLVKTAVKAGFLGLDTANQKRHYREDFAGEALLELTREGFKREELFLQSKYTYQGGQDHRLPYDPHSGFGKQVRDSFNSTLKNLHTDYLDSFLLHGPMYGEGLAPADWEVWTEMSKIRKEGAAKMIGASNVSANQLRELCAKTQMKPEIVQNRCFAVRGWDKDVREFCLANKIIYQGFSLLTANPHVVGSGEVNEIAERLQVTPAEIVLRFAAHIGILPLTGTTNAEHMKQDLAIFRFELSNKDIEAIYSISA